MKRALLLAALLACSAASAFSDPHEDDEIVKPDPARPAIGDWIGTVSWNAPIVTYGWTIFPDGSFSSGRIGRGQNGGGQWGVHDAHLTLKYADGFRYEGDVQADTYSGTAYATDGRAFGGFFMHRARASDAAPEEAP